MCTNIPFAHISDKLMHILGKICISKITYFANVQQIRSLKVY